MKELSKLTNTQLDSNVTIYDTTDDEYFEIANFTTTEDDDILDKDHPVIIL